MSYRITWTQRALAKATQLAKTDPDGIAQARKSVELLADNPRPDGAHAYGDTRYRMHVGLYRVLYEVDDTVRVVAIEHIGRAPIA